MKTLMEDKRIPHHKNPVFQFKVIYRNTRLNARVSKAYKGRHRSLVT